MALRAALHQAGAAALSQLLRGHPPGLDERQIACPCGQKARYREMRSRRVLTAVGEIELLRPWYLCPQCHTGQAPVDAALDIAKLGLSPAVRRMLALVGSELPFQQGRQQMEVLADLSVTAKAVERTAEAIGGAIAQGEQQEIQRALQLDLPVVVGQPIPILYVQMDGTGVPVVKKETAGRQGKANEQPAHTREVKLGCAFTQTTWDKDGFPIRDPDATSYTGAIENAEQFGKRIYREACQRGWSRAQSKVVIGDGAEWILNLADLHFSGALQIVDLYLEPLEPRKRESVFLGEPNVITLRIQPDDPICLQLGVKPRAGRLPAASVSTAIYRASAVPILLEPIMEYFIKFSSLSAGAEHC